MDELTDEQVKKITDLKIQAMLFDMSIDWERATLTSKTLQTCPLWLTRWKDKKNQSDFDEYFDLDKE